MILRVKEPISERHRPLLLQAVGCGISVKSLGQIDGNHTHLLLFVIRALPQSSVRLISAVAHEYPLSKPDMLDESVGAKEAYS